MKHCIVTFICFTEQNILSNLFIIQKNIKGRNASNRTVLLFQILFLRETIDNSIS